MTETTENTIPTKAYRGDLVVIELRHRYTVLGKGNQESVSYAVMLVTSVTREGHIKAVRDVRYGDDYPVTQMKRMVGVLRLLTIPKDSVDVPAVIAAVREHTYPNSTIPRDYDTLTEVRNAVRPFRTV